jgi:UDP-glucose 4-epimerase
MTEQSSRSLSILVTGGAGYIGSHIVWQLLDAGHKVTVVDNLYSGNAWAVGNAELVICDIADQYRVESLLANRQYDAVIHCAAHIWVGESVRDPGKYYLNNASKSFRLFEDCARAHVPAVVFSSSAAVYGEPAADVIGEDTPSAPINPYGASKMMSERALMDISSAHGMRYAILRYFNVAGADASLRVGEATPDNSHLIKVAMETAIGLRSGMRINGTDYATPDGTCIRDYIHIDDLARAHLMAVEHLRNGGDSLIANCGYGHGFSVREVLDSVENVTKRSLPIEVGPRRPGDPPKLVAGIDRLRRVLGWQPRHDDLDYIVRTAWQWEQKLQSTHRNSRSMATADN